MVIRYAAVLLTLSGALALILGLLIWGGAALNLVSMHMLLGILAVGSLWVIGIGQFLAPSGSWLIAVSTLLVGALTGFLGFYQSSLMLGNTHWIIQATHLLFGILSIGLGHIGAARLRKGIAA